MVFFVIPLIPLIVMAGAAVVSTVVGWIQGQESLRIAKDQAAANAAALKKQEEAQRFAMYLGIASLLIGVLSIVVIWYVSR